jgi:hypothetical protein
MLSKQTVSYWVKVCLWGSVITSVLLLASAAHCATTTSKNSLGFIAYTQRPVQYLEASIVGGSVHDEGTKTRSRLLTTVRFQPTNTFGLFTEDWTFCGDVADKINGKAGAVVLSFSSVMHHTDCYDLYTVHEVKTGAIQ